MTKEQKRKIRWTISLFLVMLYFASLTAQAQYGGGSGEPNDPYLIYTDEQMNAIGANPNDWDRHFKLMADVDLSSFTGTNFNIIRNFSGTFDGNGKKIANFSYTSTNTDQTGLFGYVSGNIKDLGLIDPVIDAGTGDYVGSLVGGLGRGDISNCYVEGGNVSGNNRVGGLVGSNAGTITNCYATSNILGGWYVGGLVGWNYSGTIFNCYSRGSVTGYANIGGLVGSNHDTITNCYATGSVSGTGWSVWGLVGSNDGSVTLSFWDIQTSGQRFSAGGTGKTTAEMQTARTFLAWGCEPIWTIDEGNDYPRLWWENMPGQIITTPSAFESLAGSGTETDPYLIYTAEELNMIGVFVCDWDKHFKLMADIDLSGYTGTDFNIIGTRWDNAFKGLFDGNSHTISNFSYTSTQTENIGLFGYVTGEIKDLGLINPNVDAGTGDDVGSLVGDNGEGTISNCYVEGGSVAGDWGVGGLLGENYWGTISNCYSEGNVTGTGRIVGGLVGWNNEGGTITNCYSASSVSGDRYVGGLVGWNYWYGFITNCYSAGGVTGNEYVGGLVGENYDGTITNCYSTAGVDGGEKVGGLVGLNWYGAVTDSFWDIETSGVSWSDGGTGKTTAELQMASTFIGWWSDLVWKIDEGVDYPRLAWENMPGELITNLSYGGGSGTKDDPYLIYTAEELNIIGQFPCDWDKHFKLMADIDLSAYMGTSFNLIWNFTGVFDGSGHTISNFSGSRSLFEYVNDPNAEIKDLGLIDPNVGAGTGDRVGSLVGYLRLGTITNCYAQGGIVSGYGGLVGSNSGTISDCYFSGHVSGDWGVGGLVGWNDGTITKCYSAGSVSGDWDAGGLVGCNSGVLSNCYSNSRVSGSGTGLYIGVGGLVGWNDGTITKCCSTGSVTGIEGVGGLVGTIDAGIINNCYSTGSVSGNVYVGGLVGDNYGTIWISNCYSTGNVAGTGWSVGGLVGYGGGVNNSFWDVETSGQIESDGRTGKTTDELQTASTFLEAGWDFVDETENGTEDIWWILEGQDYPRLWWEEVSELEN